MSSHKTPMTTGYKLVFVFSILMIFVVIIGGTVSGSKTVGFGLWYWGYIVWKMYKRDNDSLVSLQKFFLWFEAIAFSIALAILLFSDSDVQRYADVTPLGLFIIAALTMGVTFFLYKFFKKHQSGVFASASFVGASSIEDRFWEQAAVELNNVKHGATWARAFADSDGVEDKAKALYLKIRATALQAQENSLKVQQNSTGSNSKQFKYGPLHIIVILLMLATPLYFILSGNGIKSNVSGNSLNKSSDITSVDKNSGANYINYVSVYITKNGYASWSVGRNSQQEADNEAKNQCFLFAKDSETCTKLLGQKSRCVGLARDGRGVFGVSTGFDEATVNLWSLDDCKKKGGVNCKQIAVQCG